MSSFFVESQDGENISSLTSGKQLLHSGKYFNSYKVRVGLKWYVRKELVDEFKTSDFHKDILRKEFEIGQNLDHVHIARYHLIDIDTSGLFLLREYVEGVTLDELLSSSQQYFSSVKHLVTTFLEQVGSAIQYLHSKNIVYGDLSPKNIIYNISRNQFCLIDFGHSKAENYVLLHGGTFKYSAPEVLDSSFKVSPASDIYSVGKLLSLITQDYKTNRYNKIILKCCESIPERRYQSISELKRSLAPKRMIMTLIGLTTIVLLGLFITTTKKDVRGPEAYQHSIPTQHSLDTLINKLPVSNLSSKKSSDVKKTKIPLALTKYDSAAIRFSFGNTFQQSIDHSLTRDALRDLRNQIIVTKKTEFKNWLNERKLTDIEKQKYLKAYDVYYYQQYLKSDSLILAIKKESQ